MPISTPDEVYRDYETDGVPATGPHQPIKSEIRALLNAIIGATIPVPREIAAAGSYTVTDTDALIVVNLASPGTVALTLGSVSNRGNLPLTIVDWAATAVATITLTPNGTEKVGGITGAAAWTLTSAGVGMGASGKFYPNTNLSGWVPGV